MSEQGLQTRKKTATSGGQSALAMRRAKKQATTTTTGDQKTETESKATIKLKGSTKIVTEFFTYGTNAILFQRGLYPADDFKTVKKYGMNLTYTNDESLERYLKTIMEQLNTWLQAQKVSRVVLALISKETRETVERWQFDIEVEDEEVAALVGGGDDVGGRDEEGDENGHLNENGDENGEGKEPGKEPGKASAARQPLSSTDPNVQQQQQQQQQQTPSKTPNPPASSTSSTAKKPSNPKTNPNPPPKREMTEKEIQAQIADVMKNITVAVSFLPVLDEKCVFNLLIYTSKDITPPKQWIDSDPHLIQEGPGCTVEQVRLRGFSTNVHKVGSMVAYRLGEDII